MLMILTRQTRNMTSESDKDEEEASDMGTVRGIHFKVQRPPLLIAAARDFLSPVPSLLSNRIKLISMVVDKDAHNI